MAGSDRELPGEATGVATRAFRDQAVRGGAASVSHFRHHGELYLSSLGMGTYLGEIDEPTDRAVEEAVVSSIRSGAVNVIDTAINYRYQRAERSVGRSIARGVRERSFAREAVFVSTKNGYLAPDSESGLSPRAYVQQELIGTGALDPADIVEGSHAMSVPYLRDQLARSLRNLGLAKVDLLYLHNAPEAQLEAVGRKEFFERLRRAFEFYEEARRKGRVGTYGLATWDSLRKGRTEPGYLSLEETVQVAREVGGPDHGFRYLQFPLNLAMPEAAQLRNQTAQGERRTLLDAARTLGLGTFSSVPILQGRLAEGAGALPGLTAAQVALQFARSAPGHLAPLIGQKQPRHLAENLAVARLEPLSPEQFRALMD